MLLFRALLFVLAGWAVGVFVAMCCVKAVGL